MLSAKKAATVECALAGKPICEGFNGHECYRPADWMIVIAYDNMEMYFCHQHALAVTDDARYGRHLSRRSEFVRGGPPHTMKRIMWKMHHNARR